MQTAHAHQTGVTATYHPGDIAYDEQFRKEQARFDKAVENALFLNEQEKRNWKLLGITLNIDQFRQIQGIIRKENLKRLKVQHQLEKLKPVI